MHSVVLSSVHLRSFRESTISSLGISVSQRHGVIGLANWQQNVWFRNAGKLKSPPTEQASAAMWFDFVFLESFIMTATRNSPGCPSKAVTNIMTILPNYISLLVGLWELSFKIGILVSRLKLSRDSQVKSIQSRLIRDAWTLCKGFWGSPGGCFPGKKTRSLRSSNCWKCTEIVQSYHRRQCYFCIILNILRSHQADLFGSWGGGECVHTPRTPPPRLPACTLNCYSLIK